MKHIAIEHTDGHRSYLPVHHINFMVKGGVLVVVTPSDERYFLPLCNIRSWSFEDKGERSLDPIVLHAGDEVYVGTDGRVHTKGKGWHPMGTGRVFVAPADTPAPVQVKRPESPVRVAGDELPEDVVELVQATGHGTLYPKVQRKDTFKVVDPPTLPPGHYDAVRPSAGNIGKCSHCHMHLSAPGCIAMTNETEKVHVITSTW